MHTLKNTFTLVLFFMVLLNPLLGHAADISSTAVDHVILQPNDRPTVIDQYSDVQFLAAAFTASNEEVQGVTFSWLVTGDVGTISQKGLMTATKPGIGQVIAKTGTVAATIGIVVKARLAPVTNTNTTVLTTNTSAPSKTSTTTEPVVEPAPTPSPSTNESKPAATCSTVRTWVWILLIIGFAILLFIYFLTLGDSRNIWWWVWPVVATTVMVTLYNAIRCGHFFTWIPFSLVGIGILLSTFYLRVLRPRDFHHS